MLGQILRNRLFGDTRVVPPQTLGTIYAVGDIHGRVDLLDALLERILRDIAINPPEGHSSEIVFLGDYVDRGPDSREVLDLLVSLQDLADLNATFLVGNHELMMLAFLNDPLAGARWLRYGGAETLASYGIDSKPDVEHPSALAETANALRGALGPHLAFLENLRPSYMSGNVLFAHAGADPAVIPTEQTIEALAWGVPGFMQAKRTDGVWVVHGHTVVPEPVMTSSRISVDTGAYMTGRLSAAKLWAGQVAFLIEEADSPRLAS